MEMFHTKIRIIHRICFSQDVKHPLCIVCMNAVDGYSLYTFTLLVASRSGKQIHHLMNNNIKILYSPVIERVFLDKSVQ